MDKLGILPRPADPFLTCNDFLYRAEDENNRQILPVPYSRLVNKGCHGGTLNNFASGVLDNLLPCANEAGRKRMFVQVV